MSNNNVLAILNAEVDCYVAISVKNESGRLVGIDNNGELVEYKTAAHGGKPIKLNKDEVPLSEVEKHSTSFSAKIREDIIIFRLPKEGEQLKLDKFTLIAACEVGSYVYRLIS